MSDLEISQLLLMKRVTGMNKNVDAELRLLQDSSALFKSFAISLLLSVAGSKIFLHVNA